MNNLLALWRGPVDAWGFPEFAVLVVAVIAIAALVVLFIRNSGIAVPAWFWQACLIVFMAFVVIVCIRLVAAM